VSGGSRDVALPYGTLRALISMPPVWLQVCHCCVHKVGDLGVSHQFSTTDCALSLSTYSFLHPVLCDQMRRRALSLVSSSCWALSPLPPWLPVSSTPRAWHSCS
jgi:hypothetical protein